MNAVIADPRLRELFDDVTAIDYQIGARKAFILALNERLAAAERMAFATDEWLNYGHAGSETESMAWQRANAALWAYRATRPETL